MMKKEMSTEMRLLLAFVLMGVVLFVSQYFYSAPAPPPVKESVEKTVPKPIPPADSKPTPAPAPPPAPAAGEIAAAKEEPLIIETDFYRVVLSNRGGAVRSWILKRYRDGAQKPLDLVNQKSLERLPAPFSLAVKGDKLAVDINQALFVTKLTPDKLGADFEYSSGGLVARKTYRFRSNSYLTDVSTELIRNGVRLPHAIEWRGGFGDSSLANAYSLGHSTYFNLAENKLVVTSASDAKGGPVSTTGSFSFAGVEDTYFAAVFLPRANVQVELTTHGDRLPAGGSEEPHIGAAVGSDGLNNFVLFVGPKDIDLLNTVDPKLQQIVDWGWFGFLAKPLFYALNWTSEKIVHNYGWSIVLVTIIINMALMPLKWTSMKSARKMQMLQPQIQAINEKYKNVSMRDPRKAEQNQEIMDLYKKAGANPLGGCVPMLLQIPFFIAFYKVLVVAIEMRGASWLWVTDLSHHESLAIRVLPLVMLVTQFILQKMTPATGMDPAQQKVMLLMPLIFVVMFWNQSAGLVLYWLTGNLVGIVQQWFTNRLLPAPVLPAAPAPPKKKSSRK